MARYIFDTSVMFQISSALAYKIAMISLLHYLSPWSAIYMHCGSFWSWYGDGDNCDDLFNAVAQNVRYRNGVCLTLYIYISLWQRIEYVTLLFYEYITRFKNLTVEQIV